ncbi:hypothetical protein [Botrimarina mediterranea]|uniref:hypothetical protein n=1 Tax=Botrimarina mediterranea TaxID=2528022 RepID=UPI0011885BB0|nr:hypothetical protein K2D_26880 [Planctomycetes bacterium K2D]
MSDHAEQTLLVLAAFIVGLLLGGPLAQWLKAVVKAVGQLAIVLLVAAGVWWAVQTYWSPPTTAEQTTPVGPWWAPE